MDAQLAGYRLVEDVGVDPVGCTVRGVRVADGQPVRLTVTSDDDVAVLRRRAELAGAVDHPHVLPVREVVVDGELAALVTDDPAAGTLAALLHRRTRLTAGEVVTVLRPVAEALSVAHERGVLHGDLTAADVLFDPDGRPRLDGLGAVQAAEEVSGRGRRTPADVAPEVARGGPVTAASDVFGLGSLALACLTGAPAWASALDLEDVVVQATVGQWPDPGDGPGATPVGRLIRAMLDADPGHRPGAATVALQLRSAGRPVPVRFDDAAAPEGSGPGGSVSASGPGSRERSGRRSTAGRAARSGTGSAQDRRTAARRPARPFAGGSTGPRHRRPDADRSRSDDGSPATTWRRAAAVCVAAAVLVVVAVQVGLSWARWDDRGRAAAAVPPPSASGTAGPIATTTSPARARPTGMVGSGSAAPPGTAPGSSSAAARRTTAARRTSGRAAPPAPPARHRPSPAPAAVGSSTGTTSGGPSALSGDLGASPPPASGAGGRPAGPTSTPARPGADRATGSGATGGGSIGAVDRPAAWLDLVRELDQRRARAFVERRADVLDSVYTSTAAARAEDAARIGELRHRGWRVSGAAHRTVSVVRSPASGTVQLTVVDVLPAYRVLDDSGRQVASTPPRGAAARRWVLVRTAAGWRIDQVRSG
ncbi:protein kinase domain-containing protein [Nakamurella endophytica]|uniref:protein kinase domain-containing protein n=1 Tax=Nakamurella endophytica TaxID=1748367 RepID=UPI0016667A4D|nr:protein kinase [Nakamurella endophytica]